MVPCEHRERNTFFFLENEQRVKEAFKLSLGVVAFSGGEGWGLFLRERDPVNRDCTVWGKHAHY